MQFTTYIRGSLIRFTINLIPSEFDLRLSTPHIVPHVEDEELLDELCPDGWGFEFFNGYLSVFPA